jgi:hypothetical protein
VILSAIFTAIGSTMGASTMRAWNRAPHPGIALAVAALLLPAQGMAQTYTPEQKQQMIAFGEQYDTAWQMYEALVAQAKGGKPLTFANVPDWSGVWKRTRGGTNYDPDQKKGDLPTAKLKPEAQARMMKRIEDTKAGIQFDPISTCLAPGVPRWLDLPFLRDFVVTPNLTVMIAEAYNSVRRIYTDGRGHLPAEEQYPTHTGDSIGIWDGDKLIFHTNQLMAHYYERTQPDYTDQVETVEVWRKVNDNTIEADVWVFDPPNLLEPWYTKQSYTKLDDPEKIFRINYWACKGNPNNDVYMTEDGNSNFINFDFTDKDDPTPENSTGDEQ